MEKSLELLFKQIKLSEEDALIATVFAIIGFSVDTIFFPVGLPSTLVAFLTGAAAMTTSRWLKNRRFFIERSLKKIEQLVTQQLLTTEQGEYYKRRILENWLENTKGIPPQEAAKQLPPKSEP